MLHQPTDHITVNVSSLITDFSSKIAQLLDCKLIFWFRKNGWKIQILISVANKIDLNTRLKDYDCIPVFQALRGIQTCSRGFLEKLGDEILSILRYRVKFLKIKIKLDTKTCKMSKKLEKCRTNNCTFIIIFLMELLICLAMQRDI